MHEYSIVASLVDRVQREVDVRPGAVVRRLRVRIGELAGVEIPLLRTAFETFCTSTACDGAQLEIDAIAAAWRCPSCAREIERGAPLRCPACNRPATLVAGDDIILDQIEMEVRDV
jgi:hydrogenase nickel incorporation protein HypA/HybF